MTFGGVKLVPLYRKPPFVMDCHLARAFARHGKALHQIGVRELRFSTIYHYRRVRTRGKVLRALSRHALGLAIDVYQVVVKDGTIIVVHKDYASGILRAFDTLLQDATGFRKVLTPGNDPRSHYDHFHFEATAPFGGRRTRRAHRVRRNKRTRRAMMPRRKSVKRRRRRRPAAAASAPTSAGHDFGADIAH